MPHRIYLVEDHAVMRLALGTLIGCETDLQMAAMAASAEEALDDGAWADCDILLTDVSLPGLDGVTLAGRVLAQRPALPVVIVSATIEPTVVARARAAGARAYLSKARLGDTLAPTLREVLRGDAPWLVGGVMA